MKRIFIVQLALAVLVTLNSCSDLFDNDLIKTNPNAVTEESLNAETVLAGALVGLAQLHEDTDTRIAYMWSGQLTGATRQHLALSQYIVSSATFSWDDYYGTLADFRIVQSKSDEVGDTWLKGIAQVGEALIMTKIASLWGDAPYSEALNIAEFPQPKYDTQLELYNEILATLDAAIANLSVASGAAAGGKDFIFGGDVAKWKMAANTLKARLYLHLADYPNAITSALAGIDTVTNDALAPHGKAQDLDQNLNYSFFVNTRSGDTNFSDPAVLPGLMSASDFKRDAFTNEEALYNHFFQFGLINTGALDPNTTDEGFFAQNAYQPLLTFYENQLILAESYARTGNSPEALAALNSVRQVLAKGYINGKEIQKTYKVEDAELEYGFQYDDYPDDTFATTEDLIYAIVLQKYIVTLSQYESFNDVRRLKKAVPIVTLPVAPIVATRTGDLPGRYVYPTAEVVANSNIATITDQFEKLPIFK